MSDFHALEAASRAGKPIIFIMEDGTIHYAVKVLVQGWKTVFFDAGWMDSKGGCCIHVMSGLPREVVPGLWKWAGIEARVVDEDFFLNGEWLEWNSREAASEGAWACAEELVRRIGLLPEQA